MYKAFGENFRNLAEAIKNAFKPDQNLAKHLQNTSCTGSVKLVKLL